MTVDIDLESLTCFVAVAQRLHFRAAAEQLARSPAAVSDRIRRLEDTLGQALFDRTTRRVILTDAGHRLLPHALKMLEDAEMCGHVARGDGVPVPFALTIGTRFELGLSWLVPALRPLAEERAERTVHLYMGDTADLLDRLERGRLDACVLSSGPRRPDVRQALLHEEKYIFVAKGEGPRRPEEAAQYTLVDATPDLPLFRYFYDQRPDAAEWRFGHHLYVGGIAAIRSAVLDGWGVAVLPLYFVKDDIAEGRLQCLFGESELDHDHFRLLWRVNHPRDGELARLAETLRSFPLR
jgi:DNA-binding transcriptional LysR family regulator